MQIGRRHFEDKVNPSFRTIELLALPRKYSPDFYWGRKDRELRERNVDGNKIAYVNISSFMKNKEQTITYIRKSCVKLSHAGKGVLLGNPLHFYFLKRSL